MKIVMITSLLIFLSACSTHHIQYNHKNSIEIYLNNNPILQRNTKILHESRVNLSTLNIEQSVLQTQQGSILTYEDARAQSGYKFSYGVNRIIGIVFSTYNYNIIDSKGNFYFIILSKKNNKLYLILEDMNKKRLKMIYGFKENDFNEILESVMSNKELSTKGILNQKKVQSDKTFYIKSNWNMKNIIIDTIVRKDSGVKIGRR